MCWYTDKYNTESACSLWTSTADVLIQSVQDSECVMPFTYGRSVKRLLILARQHRKIKNVGVSEFEILTTNVRKLRGLKISNLVGLLCTIALDIFLYTNNHSWHLAAAPLQRTSENWGTTLISYTHKHLYCKIQGLLYMVAKDKDYVMKSTLSPRLLWSLWDLYK